MQHLSEEHLDGHQAFMCHPTHSSAVRLHPFLGREKPFKKPEWSLGTPQQAVGISVEHGEKNSYNHLRDPEGFDRGEIGDMFGPGLGPLQLNVMPIN